MRATYTYDALDRRIATEVDDDGAGPNDPVTRWTVYDGQNPYADFDGSGNLDTRYLHGLAIDELLARTDDGGNTDWYLPDRLGTIRDIVDDTGASLYHAAYDGFGSITSETGTGGDRFGFTGREFDSHSEQYYYRARYLDAQVGRFTAEDPLKFASNDYNFYRYVVNFTTGMTDPSGKSGELSYDHSFEYAEYLKVITEDGDIRPLTDYSEYERIAADAVIIPGIGLIKIVDGAYLELDGWDEEEQKLYI